LLETVYKLYVDPEYVREDPKKYEAGTIISTDREVGTLLKEGDTIKIKVQDSISEYPDFTTGEYSYKDIENFANDNNITLNPVYVPTNEYEPGTIYEQDKKAGEFVNEGDTLTIHISSEMEETIENTETEETTE